jgi:outer membrane protein TolC
MRSLQYKIALIIGCLSVTLYGQTETVKPVRLSLEEAILLAVRDNPNVQQSQLNHIQQKFSLEIEQWNFQPHYQFQAIRTFTRTVAGGVEQTANATSLQPQATLNTPIGTQFTLTSTNNLTGHYNPALVLQILQPLMRGFGRPIVEAALYDAMDSEHNKRMEVEGTLRNTVTAVIKAYIAVVSARKTLTIDDEALKRSQKAVEQTKLFIKAGHKAGVELVTVQADVARAQVNLENDKNALKQKEYALLTAIGMNPNTPVEYSDFNLDELIKKYPIINQEKTELFALENDVSYQTAQITLAGTAQRALMKAKDNTRWQLNLTANGTAGGGSGGGINAGTNSLFNGYNQSQQVALNLIIPIDDRAAKKAVVDAKIALYESKLNLERQKWDIQTNAINQWNTIMSAERALRFADDAKKLQEKSYSVTNQKYMHGLTDSIELQTAHQNLINSQQSVVNARISYLIALVDVDALIGRTLKTWNVKVRYGEWANDQLVVD